jgi:hypothetical protein
MAASSLAHADRPFRGSVGLGSHVAITGPVDWGGVVNAEIFPGGSLGPLGLRLEYRTVESDAGVGWVTAGVGYEVGASRPRLVLELHADVGVTTEDPRPVAGAGVHTTLGQLGPLAVGLDSTAQLFVDGVDSALALGGSLTIRVVR